MLLREALSVRLLTREDTAAIRRLMESSDYVHCRFTPDELSDLLEHLPAVGVFQQTGGRLRRIVHGELRAFLLVNWMVTPSAWIGGFGVASGDTQYWRDYLDMLLPEIARCVADHGAETLYYTGSDVNDDWLRPTFARYGFQLASVLRSYDKPTTRYPMKVTSA